MKDEIQMLTTLRSTLQGLSHMIDALDGDLEVYSANLQKVTQITEEWQKTTK
jgi:hypothetical protein